MFIDLQLHSTYSDGRLTPTQLGKFLARNNIKVAALTDHNTVAGIEEFFRACRKNNIKPLSGIEFYVRYRSRKINCLLYNFDYNSPLLHSFLRKIQRQRYKNVAKVLKFWQERGLRIDIDDILSRYNHYIPINGVARQIIKNPENLKKIKKDLQTNTPHEWEIIKYYFKNRKCCYLGETHVKIERIKNLQRKIGGQLILAHPAKQKIEGSLLVRLLKEKVVDGVEIFTPHHSWDTISYYLHFLKKKNIIITGGSDFHGFDTAGSKVTSSWQYFKIDSRYLRNIEKIIKV